MRHSIAEDLDPAAPDALTFDALREALGPAPWRAQAEALAARLVAGRRPWLDVQRVFSLFPPETPAGEALFRLAEALPRTPDRSNRLALLEERLGRAAGVALPLAGLGIAAMSGRFVYAGTIQEALARAQRQAKRRPAARFSFDMLGEGARTADDAARNYGHYAAAIEAVGPQPRPARALRRLDQAVLARTSATTPSAIAARAARCSSACWRCAARRPPPTSACRSTPRNPSACRCTSIFSPRSPPTPSCCAGTASASWCRRTSSPSCAPSTRWSAWPRGRRGERRRADHACAW